MYEKGTEVIILNDPTERNFYSRDNVIRGQGKKGRIGVVIVVGELNTGNGRIPKYLLSLDGQRMWWNATEVGLVNMPQTPTNDDILFPLKTCVTLKTNAEAILIISDIKPNNTIRQNIDYLVIDFKSGDVFEVNHYELDILPDEQALLTVGYKNPTKSPLFEIIKKNKQKIAYCSSKEFTFQISGERMIKTPTAEPKINGYAYVLNHNKDNNKGVCAILEENKVKIKSSTFNTRDVRNCKNWEKNVLLSLVLVKIKSCVKSIKLFGHRGKKSQMLEDSTKGVKFRINAIHENYTTLKTGENVTVYEVFNGEINLKFVAEDLEFIFPDFKGYVLPKDRTITQDAECIVVDNRRLSVKKGEKVTVLNMKNLYMPKKQNNKYSKNTFVVAKKQDGTTFVCKIKNLKKI